MNKNENNIEDENKNVEEVSLPRFCMKCGASIDEGQAFCPKCGHKVENDSSDSAGNKSKNNKLPIIIVIAVAFVLIAAILFYILWTVKSFDIVNDSAEINIDDSFTAKFSIAPSNAFNKKVKWTTSNDMVATVDSNGVIYGESEGVCTITGKVGGKSDSITITVKDGPDFQEIYDKYCMSKWSKVGTDGSYLSIDTNPDDLDDYNVYEAVQAILNVNNELGLPESLSQDMQHTSLIMGLQTQDFKEQGVSVSWAYGPSHGLEVTYKIFK